MSDTPDPIESPLTRLLDRLSSRVDGDRAQTMSGVDVSNRIVMNERQQHNFRRMDAQVDAHMKKQHGECYEAPEEEETMAGDHRINSPTTFTIIGDSAAREMSSTLDGIYQRENGGTDPSNSGTKEESSNPTSNLPSSTSNAASSGSSVVKPKSSWMGPAAVAGAALLGGGAGALGMSMLQPDVNIPEFVDTANEYDIRALPFDPETDWRNP